MRKLIGCCGLDCERCDARIATVNDDDVLREKTAKLWREMNNEPLITAETINCMGCRADGIKTYFCSYLCEIRKCAIGKGYETCAECAEKLTCPTLKMIADNAPVMDNLTRETD